DRVPTLFGRPPPRPLRPRALTAAVAQRREVVRQVVLGQEMDGERGPRVVGRPLPVGGEVATEAPGDQLVREPLLGRRQMTLEELFDDGYERGREVSH